MNIILDKRGLLESVLRISSLLENIDSNNERKLNISSNKNSVGKKINVPALDNPKELVRFVNSISVACPKCGKTGNLLYTEVVAGFIKHERFGIAIPAECFHCSTGILLSIKDGLIMHVLPFSNSDEFLKIVQNL